MFYSQSLLSRKGPLGNIWVAAFCLRKLKREQIAHTDISSSIDKIMPEADISYRVLAQLLLGIVRIFSKKVDYLYHDCNDALTNIQRSCIPIKLTVRNKAVSGPRSHTTAATKVNQASEPNVTASKERSPEMQIEALCAPLHHVTITIPERFELDSFDLEVSDRGGTDKPHQQAICEDDWTNERDQASFINEHHHWEMFAQTEYNSACFTPVDDVLPSHMMDMDLEISELHNSSSLRVRGQKVREDFQHLVEPGIHQCLGDRVTLSPDIHHEEPEYQVHPVKFEEAVPSSVEKKAHTEEPKNQVEPINVHWIKASENGKPHAFAEGHQEAATPERAHDKSISPCDSGLPSPTFAVTTPAKKEVVRMMRKRKSTFDETIVLPNEILRMGIHDASSLVCKRRKAPHTLFDAWKASKITKLLENFMEPLIPCISLKHEAFLQKKFSYHSPVKKYVGYPIDSDNLPNEIPNEPSHMDNVFREKISVNTQPLADHSQVPTPSELYDINIKELSSIGSLDSETDLMDKELFTKEVEPNNQDDGWSARTREVAQYLFNRFLNLKEQKQREIESLARILKGQTRAKCARLFYETLALKDLGCIDVQQDLPYDDIVISATPQLEAMLATGERQLCSIGNSLS